MRLVAFESVDGLAFSTRRVELERRRGVPLRAEANAAGLMALDYGDAVYRFQIEGGRLEEVTRRAAMLHLVTCAGVIDLPFEVIAAFVYAHDGAVFECAGFVVSPRYGLAFVPAEPDWVTALAAHCVETWRRMGESGRSTP